MDEKIKVLWLGINHSHLKEFGESSGLIHSCTKSEKPDVVIVVDWKPDEKTKIKKVRRSGAPTILIAQEPSVVIPKHAPNRLSHLFDYTISVGRPGGHDWINWPQSWKPKRGESAQRINRGVLINADKYSAICGELYSLRREVACKDQRIDLFGAGWSDSNLRRIRRWISSVGFAMLHRGKLKISSGRAVFKRPLHYLGIAQDKQATLEKYKFSIVIENSREYLSEKLFDCFFAGTIPIYIGPDLAALGIPKALIVEAQPNIDSVKEAIDVAAKMDLRKYQDAVARWLAESHVQAQWSEITILTDLFKKIQLWYKTDEKREIGLGV